MYARHEQGEVTSDKQKRKLNRRGGAKKDYRKQNSYNNNEKERNDRMKL